ncbi:MAG: tetratricopeptide repeat protein, partial [Betaproteobacteria bacterium]
MALNPKDEYSYQGLAQLYLGWAKRASTDAESAEYISKAEEVISQGLRIVKERDGLWIITSEIQKFFGDQKSRIAALEKAVASSPGSVIARYLLGRTYRLEGKPDKAISILEPVVKNHPDEFRAFIEYALALIAMGKPIAEAVAILNVSTTYGLSDARFIATLGGM